MNIRTIYLPYLWSLSKDARLMFSLVRISQAKLLGKLHLYIVVTFYSTGIVSYILHERGISVRYVCRLQFRTCKYNSSSQSINEQWLLTNFRDPIISLLSNDVRWTIFVLWLWAGELTYISPLKLIGTVNSRKIVYIRVIYELSKEVCQRRRDQEITAFRPRALCIEKRRVLRK